MCGAHAAVRSLLAGMIDGSLGHTVVDIEAGLEHLSRGTARSVDTLLVIVEPYFKSLETGARMAELGRELGIGHVYVVANKVGDAEDERELVTFCERRDLDLKAIVPRDAFVIAAERQGVGPLDITSTGPAVDAIRTLAADLIG